jgi:hypothetical protein
MPGTGGDVMTPFERYLTNWKSPEFAARYPDSFRHTDTAQIAGNMLNRNMTAVVALEPGDMTRYHLALFPTRTRKDGTTEYALALLNITRNGAATILPDHAFEGLAPDYVQGVLGVDEVTAAVIGAFLVHVGSHMGVVQS